MTRKEMADLLVDLKYSLQFDHPNYVEPLSEILALIKSQQTIPPDGWTVIKDNQSWLDLPSKAERVRSSQRGERLATLARIKK